jgi:glycosyltransferase involved in cell wall biosynthesis
MQQKRLRTLLTSALPDMALRGKSTLFQQQLALLLDRVPFDVVQAESIEMAQYGALQPKRSPLYVYDAFNAEFVTQRRAFTTDLRQLRKLPVAAYSFIQWQKLRAYESRLGLRFDGVLAVSAEDAAILQRVTPSSAIDVVPNGVDTEFFQPQRIPRSEQPYILFTGTLDYRANVDAVQWFVHEVLPRIHTSRPDMRFVVVGRNPTAAVKELGERRGVEIVGEVPDVRPWFDGAAAYVVPMRIGGGVRLKLLEALAMGQPVVSTPMGAEGIEGLVSGVHALLADKPDQFASQLLSVLGDEQLADRLGHAGRSFVVGRYDWRAIVPRMLETWMRWQT